MAPAGYLIAAGQQKRKGITPPALVPRPLLLYVLALQGWRPCRLSPAPRGKCLRRNGPSPASLARRRRKCQSYPGVSGGPDSAAISGRPGRHPPLDALRFAELPTALPGGERRLGTVHETSGGPSRSPPCTACRLRGVQGPPWSIFGHFLLIKKVATRALGFCLTVSQTTVLPMAQPKKES